MNLDLAGKAVLITGGSRGLGRHFALGFAKEGANVAICARNPAKLEETAAEVRSLGVDCLTLPADLFQGGDCRRVVEEAAAYFGRLDVLVNNASTNVDRPAGANVALTDDQIMERFLGKTMAAVRCSNAAVPHMRAGGGGRIVCIGGTAARSVLRGSEAASTTSAMPQGLGNSALSNFAKFLADEVASDNIMVNVVHPHITRTERHALRLATWARELGISAAEADRAMASHVPLGRTVEPEDIVPLVLLLASGLTSATTGQSIAVDGGALRGISY